MTQWDGGPTASTIKAEQTVYQIMNTPRWKKYCGQGLSTPFVNIMRGLDQIARALEMNHVDIDLKSVQRFAGIGYRGYMLIKHGVGGTKLTLQWGQHFGHPSYGDASALTIVVEQPSLKDDTKTINTRSTVFTQDGIMWISDMPALGVFRDLRGEWFDIMKMWHDHEGRCMVRIGEAISGNAVFGPQQRDEAERAAVQMLSALIYRYLSSNA